MLEWRISENFRTEYNFSINIENIQFISLMISRFFLFEYSDYNLLNMIYDTEKVSKVKDCENYGITGTKVINTYSIFYKSSFEYNSFFKKCLIYKHYINILVFYISPEYNLTDNFTLLF